MNRDKQDRDYPNWRLWPNPAQQIVTDAASKNLDSPHPSRTGQLALSNFEFRGDLARGMLHGLAHTLVLFQPTAAQPLQKPGQCTHHPERDQKSKIDQVADVLEQSSGRSANGPQRSIRRGGDSMNARHPFVGTRNVSPVRAIDFEQA